MTRRTLAETTSNQLVIQTKLDDISNQATAIRQDDLRSIKQELAANTTTLLNRYSGEKSIQTRLDDVSWNMLSLYSNQHPILTINIDDTSSFSFSFNVSQCRWFFWAE